MSEKRDIAMIRALQTVIGEMGDMPIPISALWLQRLINRAGVPCEIYDCEAREVDAIALSTLCTLALRNCTFRHYEASAPAIEWTPSPDEPGAYRVGHSLQPHVADAMCASVCIGGGAFSTIPNPMAGHHGSIGWNLTYGNPIPLRLTARSMIESYQYLISGEINMKEATHRLRLLRGAYRSLAMRARAGGL